MASSAVSSKQLVISPEKTLTEKQGKLAEAIETVKTKDDQLQFVIGKRD